LQGCIVKEVMLINFAIILRPSLWILLIFILMGYFVADYLQIDIALGIVIGLLIGFLIILKVKMI